jgi:AcrR family transcriptional regulator
VLITMGIAERRAKEKENLRRAILDAARELFVSQGYEAVSMRKIAERIEYSPTAIYLYFKDKEEILEALIGEGFLLLCEYIEPLYAVSDPIERLKAGARRYFQFACNHAPYYSMMFEMADGAPLMEPSDEATTNAVTQTSAHEHIGKRAFGFIRQCVSEGLAQGIFRTDYEEIVLAHTVWAHIHGAVALALANRLGMMNEAQQEAFFECMVESGVRGILPDGK